MPKTRQRRRGRDRAAPDGSVWIRTYPVTFLHDVTERRHDPRWHQLTFAVASTAARGHLEVITEDARRFVPADRAVWVPAGIAHTAVMRAPISMRSIFVAAIPATAKALREAVAPPLTTAIHDRGAKRHAPRIADRRTTADHAPRSDDRRTSADHAPRSDDRHATADRTPRSDATTRVRTLAVTPLLRELIVHVTRIGALDVAVPEQARLAAVLLDLIATADDVPFELPTPRDPRARRFAELVAEAPGDDRSIAQLARVAGASLRTLERCFLAETGLAVGAWRRRVRLFHALHRLEAGASVTEVALDVGYANPSAFGVAFRRQFGTPPGRRR